MITVPELTAMAATEEVMAAAVGAKKEKQPVREAQVEETRAEELVFGPEEALD